MQPPADFLITHISNVNAVFQKLVMRCAVYLPTVTIWATIPDTMIKTLGEFEIKHTSIVRRFAFNEHHYQITPQNVTEFTTQCHHIDFTNTAWGIEIAGQGIVLARASDDISIYQNQFISNETISNILKQLQQEGYVLDFEIIEDD